MNNMGDNVGETTTHIIDRSPNSLDYRPVLFKELRVHHYRCLKSTIAFCGFNISRP